MYNGIERDCESKSCGSLDGLERVKCTRQCVSRSCYDELYAWDEVRIICICKLYQLENSYETLHAIVAMTILMQQCYKRKYLSTSC